MRFYRRFYRDNGKEHGSYFVSGISQLEDFVGAEGSVREWITAATLTPRVQVPNY